MLENKADVQLMVLTFESLQITKTEYPVSRIHGYTVRTATKIL